MSASTTIEAICANGKEVDRLNGLIASVRPHIFSPERYAELQSMTPHDRVHAMAKEVDIAEHRVYEKTPSQNGNGEYSVCLSHASVISRSRMDKRDVREEVGTLIARGPDRDVVYRQLAEIICPPVGDEGGRERYLYNHDYPRQDVWRLAYQAAAATP